MLEDDFPLLDNQHALDGNRLVVDELDGIVQEIPVHSDTLGRHRLP